MQLVNRLVPGYRGKPTSRRELILYFVRQAWYELKEESIAEKTAHIADRRVCESCFIVPAQAWPKPRCWSTWQEGYLG